MKQERLAFWFVWSIWLVILAALAAALYWFFRK